MDRAALLAAMQAAAGAKPVPVDMPAWGGTVYVRQLSVADVEDASGEDRSDKRNLCRAAARVLCDQDGARLFDPSSAVDLQLLAQQPWTVLQRVLDAGDKANPVDAAGAAAGNG